MKNMFSHFLSSVMLGNGGMVESTSQEVTLRHCTSSVQFCLLGAICSVPEGAQTTVKESTGEVRFGCRPYSSESEL